MKVLVVEDEIELSKNIEKYLLKEDFQVSCAYDYFSATDKIAAFEYDLVIIDLMLPDGYGMDLLYALRANQKNTGTLILSAKNSLDDKVRGLDAGADDYLTKPFHNEELLARINALIRRAAGKAHPTIEKGPISLDTLSEEVTVNGQYIELTAYEYKVLEYLLLNPQKVISKTELTEHIYDQDFDLDSNVIEVFVGRLRKKIDPDGSINPIETLRGRGYRINREL
jgi:two-component system response regulator PhoP